MGFSRAVRVGQHIAVSGTAPINADGHVSIDAASQARRCWEIALGALAELGGRPEDVIRTRHFITDRATSSTPSRRCTARSSVRSGPPARWCSSPASSTTAWKVEVELDALVAE